MAQSSSLEIIKSRYPLSTQLSFSLEGLINNFILSAYNVRVFAFFQIVKKLNPTLLSIAIFIYAGWNMINDPLVGYFSDKNTKLTRYGRRYPLILIGTLFIGLAYFMIFLVPGENTWVIFTWLILSTCFFDLLFSIWTTNYISLMSTKFTAYTRKRITVYNALFGIAGVALGMILPGLLLFNDYENQSSYIFSAGIIGIICGLLAILMIPGIKEDASLRAKVKENTNQPGFLYTVKKCLKSKNFIAHVMYTLGQGVLTTLMLGSLQYWNQFVLKSDQPINETLVGGALLVGSICAIPVWFAITKRIGTKKTMINGAIFTCLALLAFFFWGVTIEMGIAIAFLIGVSIGAMWVTMYVSFTDVITDFSVNVGTFSEGTWSGVRMFFNRISFVIQAVAIGIVQNVTGFDQNSATQTPEAQMGLRIIMSLVPFLFYALGGILIWRIYDLTPEKMNILYQQQEIDL